MAEKKETKIQGNNLRFYEQLQKVPQEALRPISAGRLKGKTDINPVWRIRAITESFGPCGIGWKYEIVKQWQEVYGLEVKAFTNINLYVKVDDQWSDPIPGTGGATLVEVGKNGNYVNDEGYKCSLTDALSVAMKALGVAADIYFSGGIADADNKYSQQDYSAQQQNVQQVVTQPTPQAVFSQEIMNEIVACCSNDALLGVWNKYPQLWQNAQFTGAVTARKDQIAKNGKS